jgi:hypothetical protein
MTELTRAEVLLLRAIRAEAAKRAASANAALTDQVIRIYRFRPRSWKVVNGHRAVGWDPITFGHLKYSGMIEWVGVPPYSEVRITRAGVARTDSYFNRERQR